MPSNCTPKIEDDEECCVEDNNRHMSMPMWKVPKKEDQTFIAYLSPAFIEDRYPTDHAYVFGTGSAGVGLYSLDTRDAFVILRRRLNKEQYLAKERFEKQQRHKQEAEIQFYTRLQMLAYVQYRLASCWNKQGGDGPRSPINHVALKHEIRILAAKHCVPELAIDHVGQFCYTTPVFPQEITGFKQESTQDFRDDSNLNPPYDSQNSQDDVFATEQEPHTPLDGLLRVNPIQTLKFLW